MSNTVYFFFRGNPACVTWEGELPRAGEYVEWSLGGNIPNSLYQVDAVRWGIASSRSVTILLRAV